MVDSLRPSICNPIADRDLYPTGEFALGREFSSRNLARYDRAMTACLAQELNQLESGHQVPTQPLATEEAVGQPKTPVPAAKTTTTPVAPAPAASEATPAPIPRPKTLTGIDMRMCAVTCNELDVTASAWEYCDCAEKF